MAAGSRDRPLMLAPGRYPQWRSRFLRYYAVEATENSPAVAEHTTLKTPANISPENKAHFLAEKEAIHLIMTGIGDDIYSTVDACQTAQEMCEAIERLQQGESQNIQDVKTNLFWEFGKFNSHDGESMESYYTRFYKLMNEMIKNNLTVTTMQQHKLDEVSYHKLFDILKQYQNEVNELRAEKLARNANPLELVATTQASQDPFYQSSRSHKSSAPSPKPSIPSRSHTSTRHKSKEIAKPITPPSETVSKKDNDHAQAQRDKDMQKNLALIAKYFKKIYKPTNNNLRTSSNSKNKSVDMTPRYKNDDHSGQFGNQRTKAEKGKDSAYHKEKMLLCKQAEQGVPLQAEQYDCNTCLEETDDSNVTPDSPDMCEDDIQNDQNDVESDDERIALANLIANLKLDVDKNRKIQKQLKKANTTLAQELKECKANLAKTSQSLGESISVRDSCLVALQTKQTEFEKYKAFNDRTVNYDKLEYVMCSYLQSLFDLDALTKLQCMYLHKVKECDCLAQKLSKQTESVSKKVHTDLLQCFAKVEKHLICLEIAFQNCKEQVKNNIVCNEKASNVFRKEREQYFKIQDLKAQMQDKNIAISELKKLIEKGKGKYVDTKFDRPSVVRQPNAQRIPKPSVLGVNHKPNVSRPQHKSNQSRDKVLPNNSQVKAKTT
uniref:Gag-Pol polyprotein n=1 Tax=Tanacetum cinerariifolium TaxID=118510 RepID=A0A6L2NJ77_TANCI|nr:hypothetical protein [Tanacetum cinerariifolium]